LNEPEIERDPSEIDPGSVTVAYLHPNDVAHSWHESLVHLVAHDLNHEARVIRGGWLAMKCGAGGLDRGRNLAIARFLTERNSEWLFWIDSDMGFAPDTIDRLLAVADPVERPVVGGLCFAQKETAADGMGGFHTVPRPTLFDWVTTPDKQGFQGRTNYPVNAVVQVGGTGSACILIHRSVFEKIAEQVGPEWYTRIPNQTTGDLIGEDLSFCLRVQAAGFPVFVHTGVRTTHQKTLWLAEADYWRWAIAPPATEQTAVVVPVMRRPQNAKPFMESVRASTGLAVVIAVADRSDPETGEAWERAGAVVVPFDDDGQSPGTFAEKVNAAHRFLEPEVWPWLFLVGDDVKFHPGWLDHAQAVAGTTHHVVGTNDLGNPTVLAGEHATHLLVRRSYIDEVGAGWDGPGVVAHEGYRHWFVDNEIVTAARQRRVWAMALGSRVEHLHPLWGKGEHDDVYALGTSHATEDRELFIKRLEANR
jgi:hypothetical protein